MIKTESTPDGSASAAGGRPLPLDPGMVVPSKIDSEAGGPQSLFSVLTEHTPVAVSPTPSTPTSAGSLAGSRSPEPSTASPPESPDASSAVAGQIGGQRGANWGEKVVVPDIGLGASPKALPTDRAVTDQGLAVDTVPAATPPGWVSPTSGKKSQ